MKRTPLFSSHEKLGGKLIDFSGWEMPVHYSGITDEHLSVRNAAGIFDISHMGEFTVTGAGAKEFLNLVLTNDVNKLNSGEGQYTLMCNAKGGVVDDLYVYRLSAEEYLLVVNASRIEADFAWLQAQGQRLGGLKGARLTDISAETGAVAVQGPAVARFIDSCAFGKVLGGIEVTKVSDLKKNQCVQVDFSGTPVLVSRTGYTGEDGFEVVAPAGIIGTIWNRILETGVPHGLKPAGLGARDTLRTEVCYPLYGHELDENTTPIEAGLGFFVALNKPDFVGKTVMSAQKESGPEKKLIAFKMTGKSAPPRPAYPIWLPGSDKAVGKVVSGTQSPSLGIGIGMGYVPAQYAKAGTPIEIEIRGRRFPAVIVPKPIYRKAS